MRLVGGATHCAGRLEMKHQEEWRPVYYNDWNHKSSSVVCRQLDCGSAVSAEHRHGSTYQDQPTWFITSNCGGDESSLRECGAVSSDTSSSSLELICSGNKQ